MRDGRHLYKCGGGGGKCTAEDSPCMHRPWYSRGSPASHESLHHYRLGFFQCWTGHGPAHLDDHLHLHHSHHRILALACQVFSTFETYYSALRWAQSVCCSKLWQHRSLMIRSVVRMLWVLTDHVGDLMSSRFATV